MAEGCEVLWGAEAFLRRASEDMAKASRRLFVQSMTFEGDAAGRAVAAAIEQSRAADRRVLVDAYTAHVISDRFLWKPKAMADPGLRAERRATEAMFARLRRVGVGVRLTNPFGPLWFRFPARNHKKMILADDVAYVGGVNFSDHNFGWADFMFRLEHPDAADFLAQDFEATFAGEPRPARFRDGWLSLWSLDGRSNREGFAEIEALIAAAREEVVVASPYLTFPLTHALRAARERGRRVRVVTPGVNNKPLFRRYLLSEAARIGLEVAFAPGMSHVKAIVIDRERLIAGSSNFDFASLAAEEEIVAVIDDPAAAATVLARVEHGIEPAGELAPDPAYGDRAFLAASWVVAHMAQGARRTAVDWPAWALTPRRSPRPAAAVLARRPARLPDGRS